MKMSVIPAKHQHAKRLRLKVMSQGEHAALKQKNDYKADKVSKFS